MKEFWYLFQKEFSYELRQKHSLNAALLYVVSTIFLCYQSFKNLDELSTWNSLFWVIILFTSINASSKSFFNETSSRMFYLYTLASPQAVILSKIVYNSLFMTLITAVTFLFYTLFLGSVPLEGANTSLFVLTLFLGSINLSSTFTMVAAIASKTNNNMGLMAILGFPIVLPVLLTLIQLSSLSLRGLTYDFAGGQIAILISINVMTIALSYLLFPYLWRE